MTTTDFNPQNINTSFLEDCRNEGDPLADQTIQLILDHSDLSTLNQVFLKLVNNDSLSLTHFEQFSPKIKQALEGYFTASSTLPDWYNAALIQQAEAVFSEYGPEIFMLLNVSALPMCYTCAKGAQVLYDTGRLMSHQKDIEPLSRRLMETGQMIFNVLSQGGLSPQGNGIITIQKVRLIHASIRYYLLHKPHQNGFTWNVKSFGLPINQEDLAGTLMSFGPVILNGLKKLDIPLTEEQLNAYMHCWQVVGYLMGVKQELNPATFTQGFDLASSILKHQAAASEAGAALTSSCLSFLKYHVPGNAFDEVPAFMMHYFLADFSEATDKPLAAFIGVDQPENLKDSLVLKFSQYLSRDLSKLETHHLIKHLSAVFNKVLLQGIIKHFNGNKSVHFFVPESLTKNWELNK